MEKINIKRSKQHPREHMNPVMWIRIRSDPDSFGSVDPDPDSESGSRGIKSLIK